MMAVLRFLPKHLGGEADRVDGGGVRLPMPGSPAALARQETQAASPQARIWVNEARTILLTQHPNGSFSVALRDEPDAIWGPPIDVQPEGRDA
jgi:hypothetical protein